MKTIILAAALAAFPAAPALAQNAPAPPSPSVMQQMQKMHAQMVQMHRRFRAQILGYLTPAHKALLASVAGSLAIAANPDFEAAAKRLDAALSANEKHHIMSAASSMHAKMRSEMRSMRKNMPSPPPGHMMMDHPMMGGSMMAGRHDADDRVTAGGVLLMVATMPLHD